MKLQPGIELHCKQADAGTFGQLGFARITEMDPGRQTAGVKMTCPVVDEVIVSTLVALGGKGLPFSARVIGLDADKGLLLASDGKETVFVPTIGDSKDPMVRWTDHEAPCLDEAKRYFAVKEQFERDVALEEANDCGPLREIVRLRREELRLSQVELGRKLGIASGEFICMVEGGKRSFALNNIPRLADVLELDAKDLCHCAVSEAAPDLYRAMFGDTKPPRPKPLMNG